MGIKHFGTPVLIAITMVASSAHSADFSIKSAVSSVPKEVHESIAKLMSDRSVQLLGNNGAVLAEVWLRKELPSPATAEQLKNGLTYRELEETSILGLLRIEQALTDYRQQNLKPGVYTLRLGFQPMDGDHQGTAPNTEFALVGPAKSDLRPEKMSAKALQELSAKASGGSHPAVLLLYPNEKPAEEPALVDKGRDTWVLNWKMPVAAAGQKASMGIGLTLVGHGE